MECQLEGEVSITSQIEKERGVLAVLFARWCDPQYAVDVASGVEDGSLEKDIMKQQVVISLLELKLQGSIEDARINPVTLEHSNTK